ncbi:hypothetical protein AG0111_0g2786 [Alternaria gaisen]|uniref:Uncharacterized protein n=1 Tax=Alternaria gaisen TaxID=167740 RepID=A0ACB6FXC9_9PLEO|nr:hypothetical protein AG0111_0g2786 [Alternaria gaisen]
MEVFRDYTIEKALQHTYLMDIILAFTSLHSASKASVTSSRHEHVAAALHYQNQSIAEFNKTQSLIKISKENVDPVCLMTALHAITALVASLTPATPGEQLGPIAGIIMRVRRYALCMINMINEHRVWVENGELKRILDSPNALRIEEGSSFSANKMRELTDAILVNMDLDDSATPFFRSTLEKLEKSYTDNNGRSVFSWLVMVDPVFFQKANLGETAALVILGCWGTLVSILEDTWWSKYAGRRIMEEISSQLDGCDSRWDEIVQWCYEQAKTHKL